MSKEIQQAAAQALAEDINAKHAAIMALVDGVKDTAKEIGAMANEVGMALTSARDTIGPSFQHWLRENVTISTAVAERYIRHHAHYHPDQLFLPGFKQIEDRASVVAQAPPPECIRGTAAPRAFIPSAATRHVDVNVLVIVAAPLFILPLLKIKKAHHVPLFLQSYCRGESHATA